MRHVELQCFVTVHFEMLPLTKATLAAWTNFSLLMAKVFWLGTWHHVGWQTRWARQVGWATLARILQI